MLYDWFLIFVLYSTPAGDLYPDGINYVLEDCETKARCFDKVEAYEEAWPFISQFGQFKVMGIEQVN